MILASMSFTSERENTVENGQNIQQRNITKTLRNKETVLLKNYQNYKNKKTFILYNETSNIKQTENRSKFVSLQHYQ